MAGCASETRLPVLPAWTAALPTWKASDDGPSVATPEGMQAKIEEIGFGPYQLLSLLCCGGVLFSEGSEVLVMGSITRLLSDQWGLSAFVRGFMTAVVFVGFAIGNLLSGFFGDRFGRRLSILLSYVVIGAAGIATSATTNAATMVLVRIFVGIGCGIGFPSVYSMTPEVCPTRYRGVTSALMIGFMPLGEFFAAVGVVMIDPNLSGGPGDGWMGNTTWQSLVQYSALPSVFFFLISLFFLGESPHYLLTQRRIDELNKTLADMAWMNGKLGLPTAFLAGAPPTGGALHTTYSWTEALKSSLDERYFGTTLVLFAAHFTKDFGVFGLNYVFPQYFQDSTAGTSVGVEMMLISLLAIPGVLLAVALTRSENIDNRTTISLTSAACSVASVGLLDSFNLSACVYVVKFCAMAYFIATVVYTAEVFPTGIRNTAVGLCTCAGRLGSISAPLLFEVLKQTTDSFDPFWGILASLMGTISFGALCCLSIETKGHALVDDDSWKTAKSYSSTT